MKRYAGMFLQDRKDLTVHNAYGRTDAGGGKIRLAPEVFFSANVNPHLTWALFHEIYHVKYHTGANYLWIIPWTIVTIFTYDVHAAANEVQNRFSFTDASVVNTETDKKELDELEKRDKDEREKEKQSKKCAPKETVPGPVPPLGPPGQKLLPH
jgi:hypothetical protein